MNLKIREYSWAAVGIFSGCVASAAISPKNHTYFLPNFTIYWGSQLFVIVFFIMLSGRTVVVGGFSFALSIYIYCYHSLLVASHDPDASLGWVWYFFQLPLALVSGIAADFYLRKKSSWGPPIEFIVSASSVLVSVTTIPAIVWAFQMARH